MLKDPRTTIAGLVAAFAAYVVYDPATFGGKEALIVKISGFLVAGGLGMLGIFSKDSGK